MESIVTKLFSFIKRNSIFKLLSFLPKQLVYLEVQKIKLKTLFKRCIYFRTNFSKPDTKIVKIINESEDFHNLLGAISPYGDQIAIADSLERIKIYGVNPVNTNTFKKELVNIKAHSEVINSIQYSLDGKYLLSSSKDSTVNLYYISDNCCNKYKDKEDTKSPSIGTILYTIKDHIDNVFCAAFSPLDNFIGSVGLNGYLYIHKFIRNESSSNNSNIGNTCNNSNKEDIGNTNNTSNIGNIVNSSKNNNEITIQLEEYLFLNLKDPLFSISFSSNEKLFAAGSEYSKCIIYGFDKLNKTTYGKQVLSLVGKYAYFSSNGEYFSSGKFIYSINKYDINYGKKLFTIDTNEEITDKCFSNSSDNIVIGLSNSNLIFYGLNPLKKNTYGKVFREIHNPDKSIVSVGYSLGDDKIICCSKSNTTIIYG